MADLPQLIELWRERFPERARGGEVALRGFRYQFIVALRDAVRAFLNEQASEPSVFIEKVSDVFQETHDGEIVFTQVKRTGRTVTGALEELWSIHTLACDELPALVPKLRYRILCSRWMLKNVRGAIDRWQPTGASVPGRIKSFKEHVSWAADPNPFDELLALVANGLDADEPFRTVLSWIGRLTHPEAGALDVWSELQTLRNKQQRIPRSRLYLWSPEDRPPQTVMQGRFLIGEQPKLQDLREGCIAERPFYHALTENVIEWISSNPCEDDHARRTPILWLGGRSGCGKSMAFLHLLSQLHEEGLGPILWLGTGVVLLPEAVRRVPGIAWPSDQVVIALDEPYAPRTQGDAEPWRKAVAELDQLQNRTTLRPPILLGCGTWDQSRQLEEDFSDHVKIHRLAVPDTPEDRQELQNWFERRTGAPPPDIGGGDVLPMQLFFEWWTGQPLRTFALRFRKRLEEADPGGKMRNVIYRIAAVNRLYAGYSLAALDSQFGPEQKDAFGNLLKEHHFAVDEDPGRPGVWLRHPHLANALFEAWLPSATAPHQRQAVLTEAILDGLRYGDTPLDQTASLWALTRLTRADKPFRRRLEAENPEIFLPHVYAEWHRESGGVLSFSHLPAWITLRFAFPNLRFEPDPVAEALDQLVPENRDNTGFRLTCHKLLEHWQRLKGTEQHTAVRCLVSVLTQTQDWQEWPFIAIDAVWRIDNNQLRNLMQDWLLVNDQAASSMLSWLLLRWDIGPNREWTFDMAAQWTERHRDDPNASPVLSSLLKRRDLGGRKFSVVTLALDWVQKCFPHPNVERVLRRLLGVPMSSGVTARAVRLTLDYMEQSQLQPSSSFLLAAILRSRVTIMAGDARMGSHSLAEWAIRLGLTWLERYPDDPSVPYVADRLLRLPEISDAEWSKVASRSLARLHNEQWPQDADYTLVSVARRRHLLSEQDNDLFSTLLRAWLERAKESITQLLSRQSFRPAAKDLAPALPLVAHLSDMPLQEEFEAKAKALREKADEQVREVFDRSVWSLFKAHAWPNRPAGRGTLGAIGLISQKSRLIGVLNGVLQRLTETGEMDSSLPEQLTIALEIAEEALANGNSKLSGYLAAKMLPLAAHVGEPYLTSVEGLTQRLMNPAIPLHSRCGFMMESDMWIGRNAWPSSEEACRSFERMGFDTPKTLERLARSGMDQPAADDNERRETTQNSADGCLKVVDKFRGRLTRSLDLVEKLLRFLPVRAGLFLAPLLVLTTKSGDKALGERCQRMVQRFLESAEVSEDIKAGLADRVKKLTGATVPDTLHGAIESVGLQAPWLAQNAHAAATMSLANLQRQFRQAEQLAEQGFVGRAARLLAPLLALAARSGDEELQARVVEVSARLLAHPSLTHEARDGFTRACRSFLWPDPNVQDEIFQALGIGAPRLDQLLVQTSPAVPAEVLERSLDHAAEHLRADRPGSAHHILQVALPLASWADDEETLERALELAHQLMGHPRTSARLRDHFSQRCIHFFQEGRWRSSDVGRRCLARIGLRPVEAPAPSDSPVSNAPPEEPEEAQE